MPTRTLSPSLFLARKSKRFPEKANVVHSEERSEGVSVGLIFHVWNLEGPGSPELRYKI